VLLRTGEDEDGAVSVRLICSTRQLFPSPLNFYRHGSFLK